MSSFFGETHYGFSGVTPPYCSRLIIVNFWESTLVVVGLWLLGFINSFLGNSGKKKNISSRQYTFYRMKGSNEESWGGN